MLGWRWLAGEDSLAAASLARGGEKQAVVASGAQQGHSSAQYPLGRVLDLGRVFEINVSLMKTTLFT